MFQEPTCYRKDVLSVYQAALEKVQGRGCVRAFLQSHPCSSPTAVVAVGKAAASMMWGALDHLADGFSRGLVISKHDYLDPKLQRLANVQCLSAGHPIPDAASLLAGQRLVQFIQATAPHEALLFLISGGTSSLVEVLPQSISLPALQKTNQWLLSSGLDIVQMNAVRTQMSMIKGGRLAHVLADRGAVSRSRVLCISDVPNNRVDVIGSGLLVAAGSTDVTPLDLPDWLQGILEKAKAVSRDEIGLQKTTEHSVRSYPPCTIVADNSMAVTAAAQRAQALGYRTCTQPHAFQGDVQDLAKQMVATLQQASPTFDGRTRGIMHLWGGESTLRLPEHPGRGGRNQSLALAAAIAMDRQDDWYILAAGTDGSDGPGEDAGALVDGGSRARGERDRVLLASECLIQANAGAFLAESGDLIYTGPTGTNVMDLLIGLKTNPKVSARWRISKVIENAESIRSSTGLSRRERGRAKAGFNRASAKPMVRRSATSSCSFRSGRVDTYTGSAA